MEPIEELSSMLAKDEVIDSIDFKRDIALIQEQIFEDLDLLDGLRIDRKSGLIKVQDFCRLSRLIHKYVIRVPSMRLLVRQRREILMQQDLEGYCELAL